jgi:hypothetical protein
VNYVVPKNHFLYLRYVSLVGVLLLILLLTACFGGGNDAAEDTAVSPETAAPQTGSLVCSSSCASQGQCGTTIDGRTVILAHSSQATTRDHDTLIANESTINILGSETHTVADAANNQSTITFYNVQPVEGGPAGWVAGSCVNIQQ